MQVSSKYNLFDKDFYATALLYALTCAILIVYCLYACTFEKELHSYLFAVIVVASFAVTLALRTLAILLLHKAEPKTCTVVDGLCLKNPWHYLFIDLISWIFAGVLTAALSIFAFKASLTSCIEIVLACFILGVFYSRYLSLRIEKEMITVHANARNFLQVPARRFYSVSTKFFFFVMVCLTLLSTVVILLFYKDFSSLSPAMKIVNKTGFETALAEFLFAIFVLCAGAIAVAYQYRCNFQLAMQYQMRAFNAVEQGNYETMVPVVTEDEFSLIAVETNRMILGLRERNKIKAAFGKYMSPVVANAILQSEAEASLEGRLVNVVIMFIDIRGYTALSEKHTPQQVVQLLNSFFSLVIKCTHKHHGVVDKFIGDAAMIIFGLDERSHMEELAIEAAFDMIRGLPLLNANLQGRGLPPIQVGIGVHKGSAIAGNIGSDERLEYTAIGDAVNVASRLESLTRELGVTLNISRAVYECLPERLKNLMHFKGIHPLKGKSEETAIYSFTAFS